MPVFTTSHTRILFVHIPKTAGTSIEESFATSGWKTEFLHCPAKTKTADKSPCNPQHYHQLMIKHFIKDDIDDEFTVVRHPFTRLISEMLWRNPWAVNHIKTHGFNELFLTKFQNFSIHHMKEHIRIENEYLLDPPKFLETDRKFHFDNHFRPQHDFVSDNTTVYKFEELEQSWATIKNNYGLHTIAREYVTLPITHVRPKTLSCPIQEFSDLYSELYTLDHKKFNYDMPF